MIINEYDADIANSKAHSSVMATIELQKNLIRSFLHFYINSNIVPRLHSHALINTHTHTLYTCMCRDCTCTTYIIYTHIHTHTLINIYLLCYIHTRTHTINTCTRTHTSEYMCVRECIICVL